MTLLGNHLEQALFGAGQLSLRSRMNQFPGGTRHETVGVQIVFLKTKGCIAALQIPAAVIFDTVAQDQVLRAGRTADRISLHETESFERSRQAGGLAKRRGNCMVLEIVQRDGHEAA